MGLQRLRTALPHLARLSNLLEAPATLQITRWFADDAQATGQGRGVAGAPPSSSGSPAGSSGRPDTRGGARRGPGGTGSPRVGRNPQVGGRAVLPLVCTPADALLLPAP